MVHLSSRSRNTPASPIRRLSHLANSAISQGKEVFHLNIGQPDLLVPPQFVEGLQNANAEYLPYAPSEGIPKFRKEWADWIGRSIGIQTPEENYLVTMGASEGLVFLFTACCDPNDEVIIFDPTYANYVGFAAQSGVRLISLLTSFDEQFSLPEDSIIEKHITSRTRAILFCNPNNPTGVTYSLKEIARLRALCHKYNLLFIVDETYREFVYDGMEVQTALSLSADDPQMVVVDSLSKRFSLCGARLGTLYIPSAELREKILHLAQARLSAPTIEQKAASYMLQRLPDSFVENTRVVYESRRNALLSELQRLQSVRAFKPTGAFYLLAKLPVRDAERFAMFLLSEFDLDNQTVFLSPAKGFYTIQGVGADKVRLAFVLEEEKLQRAVRIIEAALSAYQN